MRAAVLLRPRDRGVEAVVGFVPDIDGVGVSNLVTGRCGHCRSYIVFELRFCCVRKRSLGALLRSEMEPGCRLAMFRPYFTELPVARITKVGQSASLSDNTKHRCGGAKTVSHRAWSGGSGVGGEQGTASLRNLRGAGMIVRPVCLDSFGCRDRIPNLGAQNPQPGSINAPNAMSRACTSGFIGPCPLLS